MPLGDEDHLTQPTKTRTRSEPFRNMLAHPKLTPHMHEILGKGFRLDHNLGIMHHAQRGRGPRAARLFRPRRYEDYREYVKQPLTITKELQLLWAN